MEKRRERVRVRVGSERAGEGGKVGREERRRRRKAKGWLLLEGDSSLNRFAWCVLLLEEDELLWGRRRGEGEEGGGTADGG